ncbi:MAG TPA: hypothetical protein VGP82_20375 [Ktedonobacterales bacterium]|nr:hypothetical protein [Ktedonobacterales bacterium]
MALRDAISFYHDLLSDELAAESQAQLDEQLHRRGLLFGDRPLCTVLRPRFFTPEGYRYLQERLRIVLGAFDRVYRRALEDPALRAQFGLQEWEERLIEYDPGFPASSPTARLDTFFQPETNALQLVEYNAETPAAPAYNDVLTEVFYGLPVMGAFYQRYMLSPLPARQNVLYSLLNAYRAASGSNEKPRLAVLDWREVPTYSEHLLFTDYFHQHGLECVTADPRNVEYRDGRLMAGDYHVTLIYKRVLLSELVERCGLDSAVMQAVRDGAVCMANPLRCKILHKKASLAVLSDERNAELFTAEQREAIATHIPWTRRVEARKTTFRGAPVDLVPLIHEQRERFVLKSNDEYGGKGIVLGWQTDAAEWQRAVQTALAEPFVVQERVEIPSEAYPSMVDGRVVLAERIQDTAPFVFEGQFVDGCLTRLSTEALVNVTAGGGSTVPTFIVADRP